MRVGKSVRERLRFDHTIGFRLGALIRGKVGCVLGASAPYHHPVAVTLSTLWWGTYLACFGASVGAQLGMAAEGGTKACSH